MASIFIRIDGIPGESTDAAHADWIEALAYSWGAERAGLGFGGAVNRQAGRVAAQDFTFVARISRASPKLFEQCVKGTNIAQVVIELTKPGGEPVKYLQWTLTDVIVSSYQTNVGYQNPLRPADGTSGGTELPVDQVRLSPATVTMTYTVFDTTGASRDTVAFGWDFSRNAAR